jgi:sugar phosphate isomerase/epimerase
MNVETIKVSSNLDLTDVPFETYVKELRLLADQAADAGARVAMEFISFAHFSGPRSASELMIAADHPTAGLCVDIWHVYRSGMRDYDELITTVPHEKMFVIELNDAARTPQGTLIEDSCNGRKYPGDGEFDVSAFVRAIRSTGFDGHWGVEIISDEHRATPINDGMRRAYDTALASLWPSGNDDAK